MKAQILTVLAATAIAIFSYAPAQGVSPNSLDIKHAAPTDAFLAVYTHHNPARDYQQKYVADAWKTIQDEQIGQRLLSIVSSRMPADKLAAAKTKVEELQAALEPLSFQAVCGADEMVIAEAMQGPFNQVLWAVRLKADEAANCEQAAVQAFQLFANWSEGRLTVQTIPVKEAKITLLVLPQQSPFQPAVARLNDIVVVSTDLNLLRRGVEQLQDPATSSKFDDPRLQEALTHLPKPEDALVFFDGRQLFQSLHGIGDFIRTHARNEPNADRVTHWIDRIVDEVGIVDYQATVEFTEPGQKHTVGLIKMTDGFENKLLGRVLGQGKPIENWQSWVPQDATAYSIHHGINLHELYQGVIALVREEFPESQKHFDRFAEMQEKIGVNIDRDILQSFTGECLSVTMPITLADGSTQQQSVTALQCENPDKMRELLAHGIDALNKNPAVQLQQLKLEDDGKLAGFQQLHAAIFQMFGVQPVIGFSDGWMIMAAHPEAVEKLLAVRAGKAPTIDSAAAFKKIGMDPNGPVYNVTFRDVGADIRHLADMIDRAGTFAPMFLSMAATKAQPEEIKTMQDVIELFPSVAKVVRKLDFFGHCLSITRPGPLPGTYLQESVIELSSPDKS